jgi:hypothetical protein
MKLLIFLIKWGFPVLLITDLSSELLDNELLLNISRILRISILALIVKENIRLYKIIKHFYFFKYFLLFLLVLFLYLYTDRNTIEGFWIFSKMLFWILGINVLYAYGYLNLFRLNDFKKVIEKVVFLSFILTIIFYQSGSMETNYNVASYLILFMYPILLYTSEGYKKNKFFILLSAFAILITLKRGAMIGFFVGNLIYILVGLMYKFNFKKLVTSSVIFSFMIFSGLYIYQIQENSREQRFSQDQFDVNNESAGSGRVGMYTRLYEEWFESDNRIFGFGNQEDSYRNIGRRTHAHSDIFGFLYNHGIVGITLIMILYIKILKFYFYCRNYDKQNLAIMLSFLLILILVNFYSGMLRSQDAIYFFALLPYLQLKRDAIRKSAYINQSA